MSRHTESLGFFPAGEIASPLLAFAIIKRTMHDPKDFA
jgi:hypothetical protein